LPKGSNVGKATGTKGDIEEVSPNACR